MDRFGKIGREQGSNKIVGGFWVIRTEGGQTLGSKLPRGKSTPVLL